MKPTRRKHNWIITAILDVLCWIFKPLYLLFSEIDERYHRGKEWDVAAPAKPDPPTKMCPFCQHGTPLSGDYCTHCGKCVNPAILALAGSGLIQRRLPFPVPGGQEEVTSKPLPALHMSKRTRSAMLRVLEAAGSPAYDPSHSNPRLLAASVLFPGDTMSVPSVRMSSNPYRERETPPGMQRYGEVSNG